MSFDIAYLTKNPWAESNPFSRTPRDFFNSIWNATFSREEDEPDSDRTPIEWTYRHTDSLDTMLSAGYFNAAEFLFHRGDIVRLINTDNLNPVLETSVSTLVVYISGLG